MHLEVLKYFSLILLLLDQHYYNNQQQPELQQSQQLEQIQQRYSFRSSFASATLISLNDKTNMFMQGIPFKQKAGCNTEIRDIRTELPTNCADALQMNNDGNGVYAIYLPKTGLPPFYVYCLKDPYNGVGWTIIQRREDGSVDFYRGWQDYKYGFGNLQGEYFIGLEKLHAITHSHSHELWIELQNFDNQSRFAKYETFEIGNENERYALNILGSYSGTAGDSLSYHVGQKFTTKDFKNDLNDKGSCAVEFTGAWWYNQCHWSNLNGQYLLTDTVVYAKGINWVTWLGHEYSLKYVHMAIRPVNVHDNVDGFP